MTSCPLHSAQAFAFRRADGTVMTWGHEALGGNSKRVKDQLVDVKQILGLRDAHVLDCENLIVSLVSLSIYVYDVSMPCTSAYPHIIPNISYHITSYHILSYPIISYHIRSYIKLFTSKTFMFDVTSLTILFPPFWLEEPCVFPLVELFRGGCWLAMDEVLAPPAVHDTWIT